MVPFEESPEGEEWLDEEASERLDAVITAVREKAGHVGLHMTNHVQAQQVGDRIVVQAMFQIGQLAWANRVQNPEQDKFDDSFRSIEESMRADEKKSILDKYRKGNSDDDGTRLGQADQPSAGEEPPSVA